jgi:hypothetical protein
MMPSKQLLPRRADLVIDILPAIAPGDENYASSRKLAEASRQSILAAMDEPDLLADEP